MPNDNLFKTPGCDCFKPGVPVGEEAIQCAVADTFNIFYQQLASHGICPEAHNYSIMTLIAFALDCVVCAKDFEIPAELQPHADQNTPIWKEWKQLQIQNVLAQLIPVLTKRCPELDDYLDKKMAETEGRAATHSNRTH